MEDDAYITVQDGGTLVVNTGNINLNNSTTKIIIKSGGTLTTTENQAFDFDGPGKLIIEEGAIIDMPFNLTGVDENTTAIRFVDDSASPNEHPFINMEHNFYLKDCKFTFDEGSQVIINDARVNFNNVKFYSYNSNSTVAFTGNNLVSFICKDSNFNNFSEGIVLNDYTEPAGDPMNPCYNPIHPTFRVINCNFDNIVNTGVHCTDIFKLFAENNTFTNSAIGNNQQAAIAGYACRLEILDNNISTYYTGVYFNAGGLGANKLNFSGGDISYCNTAIRTTYANAEIKYCAKIHHNVTGIHSTANGLKNITIGRKGGASITDNDVGIIGFNIILDVDAINAISENDDVHHPNDFSGNATFFNLSYNPNVTPPTGLSARGNYWGANNGCGVGIDAAGTYIVPSNFIINDAELENDPPTSDCLSTQTICGGAAATSQNNTSGINTNFNLIYAISNDYLEEEAYNYAHFGFSLVADYEDEPVYNSLQLDDQNTVVLSRVQQEFVEEITLYGDDGYNDCFRGNEDIASLFPKINISENESEDYDLIESVSPNPFTHTVTLSTFIKGDAYLVEIFNAYNINGRSLLQLKTEDQKNKIDVSNLKPGIYAVKVTDSKGKTDYVEILKAY